jgi:micrococcal nuclease
MTELFVAVVLSFAVIDGDTIDIKAHIWPNHMTDERVRLLRIDTPEKTGVPECEKILAAAATDFTRKQLTGARIIVVKAQAKRDSFGRSLAEVFVDGVNLNDRLLQSGLARPFGVKGAWC